MTIPPAHAGHVLADALYAVPVLVIVGWISIRSLLDRRAERREAGERREGAPEA